MTRTTSHRRHLRIADPETEAQRAEALAGIRDLEANYRHRIPFVLLDDPEAAVHSPSATS